MENKNQLIQYQLINPSDPYTFLAPDLETAAKRNLTEDQKKE